jgi:DNA-binding LacI/PurR family transcriptional regulator
MVTLKQVAEKLGVSAGTVSAILNTNRAELFTPAMRAKVKKAAQEMGYRPNRSARTLRGVETKTLGIIANGLLGYQTLHISEVLRHIDIHARKAGYLTLFEFYWGTENYLQKQLDSLQDQQVSGIIFAGIAPPASKKQDFSCGALPPIVGVCSPDPVQADLIEVDRTRGAAELAEYAWNLGHRSFAMVTNGLQYNLLKYNGTNSVLSSRDAIWSKNRIIDAEWTPSGLKQAASWLLALTPRPTCVLCSNDYIAVQIIHNLRLAGLCIPEDISVTGFDSLWIGEMSEVPLATVRQPFDLIGRTAVDRILARIKNPELPQRQELLTTTLVQNESLGAAPSV